MNLYISDLHFGHKNVIKFDGRPFSDVDEMDRCLIELWNSRVAPEDDVFILGDFAYRNGKSSEWYLERLTGHKHLIIGNHDHATIDNSKAMKHFESVDKITHVIDGDKQIVLCHYPIADWYKGRHSSWHIYGHIHNNKDDVYQFMRTRERALNAGACINNYTPASFDELVRNNRLFNEAEGIDIDTRISIKGSDLITLRYLYELNPEDEKAEVILESKTLEPIVSCVEHFWGNLGVEIPYFRFIDYAEKGIIIDFGHHHRFYQVIGYSGDLHRFNMEWEKACKLG